MSLRTLICDDEPPALELMATLLEGIRRVELVAKCLSAREALERINEGGIDLAIFDIEMPEMSGVDVISSIAFEPKPLLVFATAHAEYAVEAFDVDAIDYIVKPIEEDRVRRAIDKAERLHASIVASKDDGSQMIEDQDRAVAPDAILKVPDAGRIHFIAESEVIWVEAAGDYSIVHTREGKNFAMRATLASLQKKLAPGKFARVHRSAIIASGAIKAIKMLPKGEASILLEGDVTVRSSRTYRDTVRVLAERE